MWSVDRSVPWSSYSPHWQGQGPGRYQGEHFAAGEMYTSQNSSTHWALYVTCVLCLANLRTLRRTGPLFETCVLCLANLRTLQRTAPLFETCVLCLANLRTLRRTGPLFETCVLCLLPRILRRTGKARPMPSLCSVSMVSRFPTPSRSVTISVYISLIAWD